MRRDALAYSSTSHTLSSRDTPSGFEAFRAETSETANEKTLRERKSSLVRLFKACHLHPSRTNEILKGHNEVGDHSSGAMLEQFGGSVHASVNSTQSGRKSSPLAPNTSSHLLGDAGNAPIVLDDEDKPAVVDDQPNDGTEVSANELDQVYSKAQLHDPDLPEVEPSETFALTLRPYQKQALGWMMQMERAEGEGGGSEREKSLHPLWEE